MSLSYFLAFLTGTPGPAELIVLFVAILLLFGPKRLPSIAKSIGKTLDELRRASQDFKDQIMKIEDEEDDQPIVDVESRDMVAADSEVAEGDPPGMGEPEPIASEDEDKAGEDDKGGGETEDSKHDLAG